MTLTIIAVLAFFAHVVLWVRLPAGADSESLPAEMVLEMETA